MCSHSTDISFVPNCILLLLSRCWSRGRRVWREVYTLSIKKQNHLFLCEQWEGGEDEILSFFPDAPLSIYIYPNHWLTHPPPPSLLPLLFRWLLCLPFLCRYLIYWIFVSGTKKNLHLILVQISLINWILEVFLFIYFFNELQNEVFTQNTFTFIN